MDVRWSAIYLMIDRVLEIYAVNCYLDYSFHSSALIPLQVIHILFELEENMSIKGHELSEAQLKALEDVRELSIPHEIVSAEKTPTPLYERLLHLFRLNRDKIPRLSRVFNASIEKLEKYLTKVQKNRIYVQHNVLAVSSSQPLHRSHRTR